MYICIMPTIPQILPSALYSIVYAIQFLYSFVQYCITAQNVEPSKKKSPPDSTYYGVENL